MPETPQRSPKSKGDRRPDSRPVSPRSQALSSEAPTAPPPGIALQSSTFRTPATPNPVSISTPNLVGRDKPRHDSFATTASTSSASTFATSPGASTTRGGPAFIYPHPRDLSTKGRRIPLSHSDENPAEKVAELTAKFRISIPLRKGSNGSDTSKSSASLGQGTREAQDAKDAEAEKKRKELGRKLAQAFEKGDVVVAPSSAIDERKLREVRLDSAINLGSSREVPLRLSTGRSKSGTESGDIKLTYPTPSPSTQKDGDAKQNSGVEKDMSGERQEVGDDEGVVPDNETSELGRTTGGPSYQPAHRLRRQNSSLTMATAKANGVKHVVIAPPPGSRTFGKSNLRIPSIGGDRNLEEKLSHAALLRLPPAAAATKSVALLNEGPMPRRKSLAKNLQKHRDRSRSREREGLSPTAEEPPNMEASEDEDSEEGDEWDEESLLALTDWWRQVLAAGATPSPKEMAMMDAFLGEFMKEEMPDLHLILRTRLHRLLVAIIDGAEIRGEGEEEEKFHELARKAALLERRWMKATKGQLFGMEKERRDIMFGKSGRLNMVKPWSRGDEPETRWVTERNEKAGMVEVEAGTWWLNTTCAYRDGVIGNTSGYVSNFKQHAHPTLVLEVGEEFPTSNINITRYINEGSIYYMLLPLMSTLDRPIRVLRNWTLKSKLAPPAGLRFDGWYNIISFSHKRISMEEDVFRVEVLIERRPGQVTMARILMIPSPSMLDEWEEYMAIRDDEMRREKSTEEYEEWHRREREAELERELWLCQRAEEEARAVEGGAEVVEAWGYPSD